MPLPDRGAAWPPPELETVYDTYRQWDAWYVGDPDGLRSYYGSGVPAAASRGGIVGALARWFWGRPNEATQTSDNRLHVPVAADIAMTSADLLFGEQVDFASEDQAAADRLTEIADDGMHATLVEAAEVAAALGGVYLRVAWDSTLADAPWLSAVHPDAAVPEWRWGKLAAVTFWRVVAKLDGDRVLRLLERHEPGRIEYGLYEGGKGELGRRVPLTEHPGTAGLAQVVDASSGVGTGAEKRMTAVYVPNVRPSRRWRNNPGAAHLGRSDLDGIEHLMDALDETYSSWMRDIRLGKGRILVPDYMLQSNGRGQGASFNLDREVFVGLNVEPGKGSTQGIEAQQFEIRVEEHRDTAQDLLEKILRTAGYSAQTFGMMGDVAITATEVQARERRSYMTRDKKIRYWRPALAYILESLLAVDRAQFGSKVSEGAQVTAHFPDGVSDSIGTLAQTANLLTQAEAASTQTLVEMLHPDWDETQVRDEVERIQAQTGRAVTDPGTFTGDVGGGGDDEPPPEE